MRVASPLRYPGGKSVMADLLSGIRRLNRFTHLAIAEPFAGGAGASLTQLFMEETKEIYINDADAAIHDFWWSLVNQPKKFLNLLANVQICMAEWKRQRDVYKRSGRVSRIQRGFAAFILNRCNRSGIVVNGGPIGGIKQSGRWKLDARFNKVNLQRRCEKVAEYGERINVSCCDGIEFFERTNPETTMYFIDPPYFEKGPTLYLNTLDEEYHQALANRLRQMKDKAWVLTYDDCPKIRAMYRTWAHIQPYSLRYTANKRRHGNEILIVPKWTQLPSTQDTAVLRW